MTASADLIKTIIDTAGSQFVSVTFLKKDGSERRITFNPSDHNDIKGTGSPCSNPNIFRVREVSKGQWRSFDATRVLKIKVGGQSTTIHQEAA